MSFPTTNSHLETAAKYMHTGIFKDERVLQFLHILINLAESIFQTLKKVAQENTLNNPRLFIQRFRKGLDVLLSWKLHIRMEIAQSALEEYGYLDKLYHYTIIRYLKELFKHEKHAEIPVHIPPFHEFLYTFYCNLAQSNVMQTGEYFKLYGMERTHLHMYMMRQTLMQIQPHLIQTLPGQTPPLQPQPQPQNNSTRNPVRSPRRSRRNSTRNPKRNPVHSLTQSSTQSPTQSSTQSPTQSPTRNNSNSSPRQDPVRSPKQSPCEDSPPRNRSREEPPKPIDDDLQKELTSLHTLEDE